MSQKASRIKQHLFNRISTLSRHLLEVIQKEKTRVAIDSSLGRLCKRTKIIDITSVDHFNTFNIIFNGLQIKKITLYSGGLKHPHLTDKDFHTLQSYTGILEETSVVKLNLVTKKLEHTYNDLVYPDISEIDELESLEKLIKNKIILGLLRDKE